MLPWRESSRLATIMCKFKVTNSRFTRYFQFQLAYSVPEPALKPLWKSNAKEGEIFKSSLTLNRTLLSLLLFIAAGIAKINQRFSSLIPLASFQCLLLLSVQGKLPNALVCPTVSS